MATFPASLPKPLQDNYQPGAIDPWVEDAPEVGSNARRKRVTRALKTFSFTLRLTTAELATLETFYETTLSDGVDSFSWTDPVKGTVYTVRFDQRFSESPIGPYNWDVSMAFTEV